MASILPTLWSPFDQLREGIENTFDRWLSRRPQQEETGMELFTGGLPRIDLEEDEKEIRVKAEMPGLDKEDFKVELSGNHLTIQGEKKTTNEEKKRNYYFSECSYGSFSRVIPLPSDVDAEKTQATYKNGILELHLPKTQTAKSKPIDVKLAA